MNMSKNRTSSNRLKHMVESIVREVLQEVKEQTDWKDYKLSKQDELISMISDTYKDIYGFRPRGHNYDKMSVEELEAIAKDLFDQYAEQEEYEFDNYGIPNYDFYQDDDGEPWPREKEQEVHDDDMYDELDFDKHGGKFRGSQIRYTNEQLEQDGPYKVRTVATRPLIEEMKRKIKLSYVGQQILSDEDYEQAGDDAWAIDAMEADIRHYYVGELKDNILLPRRSHVLSVPKGWYAFTTAGIQGRGTFKGPYPSEQAAIDSLPEYDDSDASYMQEQSDEGSDIELSPHELKQAEEYEDWLDAELEYDRKREGALEYFGKDRYDY